ncbi:FecR domain-containing protein [Chitinophaga niabensis]|uniref:FecR family protein n=1 Tax=Chitinophaga niabensis TaxID=536979 RepID=UPI0031B9C026
MTQYTHEEKQPGENDPLEASVKQISLSAGNEVFQEEEKAALWERIENDFAVKQPLYRRIGWKAVAATAAVLIAATWWLLPGKTEKGESGILQFAKQQHISDTTTETRLMLGNNRQMTLNGTNATLKYNQQGVLLNNSQQVDQAHNGEQYNTLIVPYGRRAHITLEDGTVAWLNAGSRMIYPVVFDGLKREVFLEGEAYFDVSQKADVPFFVYTNKLRTTVLGTGFNVSAYADDAEQSVVLVSGNVKVKANSSNNEQLLSPGEKAGFTISDERLSKQTVNTLEYTSWKDGKLQFEHAPLNHIVKRLGRYFNIRITLQASEQATFSGDLDLADDVETVLDAVSASTGLTYKRTEEGFIFKK